MIPAGYTGTESFTNLGNVPIIDLRAALVSTGLGGSLRSTGSPQFGSYLFSVTNGIVSAQNLNTGNVDFTGTDAAAVINSVLTALINTGGQLLFKSGIYNIQSFTNLGSGQYGGIVIPSTLLTQATTVQFFFTGESGTPWIFGGGNVIETKGVIFNVTPAAVATVPTGSGATANAIFQVGSFSNNLYFKNICVRFPSNQTENQTGINALRACTVDYENVMADFNIAYPNLQVSAQGNIGLTSTANGAGNQNHFTETYAVGYYYGYYVPSEHFVADTIASMWCVYAGKIDGILHPCVLKHIGDAWCINGWQAWFQYGTGFSC